MAGDQKITDETPIPESLRRELLQFRRSLWRTKIVEAALAGLFGLVASFLLVFALDRIWPTPGLLRLAILLGGASLAAIFAPIWLHRWVWRHRRDNQLARLIAKKHPGLGDRLLGVVELQSQHEGADTLSPRLRAAAMEHVAAEVERRKLVGALPQSRGRAWSLAVLATVAAVVAGFLIAPRAGWSSLQRWLMPLSSSPRYTFTSLKNVADEITIPQGEAFRLSVSLADDSEWTPARGIARYGRQDPVAADLADRSYHFDFPAQQDPGVVRLEIGDARHSIRILPALRPAIGAITAQIRYPAYLERPESDVDLGSGVLSVVQGGTVVLSAEATRNLQSASFGPLDLADLPGGPMSIDGAIARTPPIAVGEVGFTVPISWTDHLGLSGDAGFQVKIESVPDEPPGIYIQGVARQHAMLPGETIEFEVISDDDFGLRRIGLEWRGEFTRATDGSPASGELKLADGGPLATQLAREAAFSPATHGITPQKLTLRAWAEDYLPGRSRVYSQPVILHVLTLDDHAQMLKAQFDRAISELEDLARRERDLFEENQRLERLEGEQLQEDAAQQRLESQQDAERQQADRMDDLAERMEDLFKQSARNESIDKETMRKMADALRSMKELSSQDLPGVEEKLGEAGEASSSPEKAEEDMAEAVERQREALEKMEEAVSQANDANERFEASTFVNRLKKAASDESGLAASIVEPSFFERAGGLHINEVDPSDLGRLAQLARQQASTASDVRWIQEDLGHFHARTNKEAYREVLDAMIDARIDIKLEDLYLLIEDNKGALAWEAAGNASTLLAERAKLLEGAQQQDGGGGGGGGGGSPENPDEDFEFMLRVMKMIQQEQDIRARTRSLETLRRSFQDSPENKP